MTPRQPVPSTPNPPRTHPKPNRNIGHGDNDHIGRNRSQTTVRRDDDQEETQVSSF